MTDRELPKSLVAEEIPARPGATNYPEPYATRMRGRTKRVLGNPMGITNFGVNLTDLAPGGASALLHRHETQDEFVYILEGRPTLVTESGEQELAPGMCAGFPKGGEAHQLVNRTEERVRYLEIGDRSPGDQVEYPQDDLAATWRDGGWVFTTKADAGRA